VHQRGLEIDHGDSPWRLQIQIIQMLKGEDA
jgi:hypothetical protein